MRLLNLVIHPMFSLTIAMMFTLIGLLIIDTDNPNEDEISVIAYGICMFTMTAVLGVYVRRHKR